jgi:hypothetical protein
LQPDEVIAIEDLALHQACQEQCGIPGVGHDAAVGALTHGLVGDVDHRTVVVACTAAGVPPRDRALRIVRRVTSGRTITRQQRRQIVAGGPLADHAGEVEADV